ncbi:Imm26 family immunity protein [Streptomyces rishiriensis]|uniref:Imm26 family immunity protein n=1 Tax=Streptomyces rishiriensis TaxID=68264 RepID=UPI000D59CCCF
MVKALPYKSGDVFAVPLRDFGHVLGVVARMDGRGVVPGYFFGGRISSLDGLGKLYEFDPSSAIHVCRFGDRGLLQGRWAILGELDPWDSRNWPVPTFRRNGEILVSYDDSSLALVKEERVVPQVSDDYPNDGLEGAGFVEIKLTRLVSALSRPDDLGVAGSASEGLGWSAGFD